MIKIKHIWANNRLWWHEFQFSNLWSAAKIWILPKESCVDGKFVNGSLFWLRNFNARAILLTRNRWPGNKSHTKFSTENMMWRHATNQRPEKPHNNKKATKSKINYNHKAAHTIGSPKRPATLFVVRTVCLVWMTERTWTKLARIEFRILRQPTISHFRRAICWNAWISGKKPSADWESI